MRPQVHNFDGYRYPFHLRPKNKQVFQYYRMAGDLSTDLELDQELPILNSTIPGEMNSLQLDRLRAYLAYHYAVSKYVSSSSPHRNNTYSQPQQLRLRMGQDGLPRPTMDVMDCELLRAPPAPCRSRRRCIPKLSRPTCQHDEHGTCFHTEQ